MKLCDILFKDKPIVIASEGEKHEDVTYSLALVVGHNSRHRGAVNYLGESEYDFNSRVAKKLQHRLKDMGINSVVIFRPDRGGYDHEVKAVMKQMEQFSVTTSLHLHFNSADTGVHARGAEVLLLDMHGKEIAESIMRHLYLKMGITTRGLKGLEPGHRGHSMLEAAWNSDITAMIIEPTFAHYRHTESIQVFENEDLYVQTLAEAIQESEPGQEWQRNRE